MKNSNGFVAVKATKIKYDPEFIPYGMKLPKRAVVNVRCDELECMVEPGESGAEQFDREEVAELLSEILETKTGVPVLSLDWSFR